MTSDTKINCFRSADFLGGKLPKEDFKLPVNCFKFRGVEFCEIELTASYNRRAVPIIDSVGQEFGMNQIFANNDEIAIEASYFDAPIELHSLAANLNFEGDSTAKMMPRRTPLTMTISSECESAEAIVLNGPNFHFAGREFEFYRDGYHLKIEQIEAAKEFWKTPDLSTEDAIPTAICTLTHENGRVEREDAWAFFNKFSWFLTFLKGGQTGIGNIVGVNAQKGVNFFEFGFSRHDPFAKQNGWWDIEIVKEVNVLFDLFMDVFESEIDGIVLRQAIDFYRSSNSIRSTSLEMAIVASHAALEVLVNHTLHTRGGWTDDMVSGHSKEIHFHEKSRASAALIGLEGDLFENSPNLRSLSKSRNGLDAFSVISLFRNRIAHSGKKFEAKGIHFVEVWLLLQWLCEIHIFYFMGYHGIMYDRRRLTGWKGPAVEIPLKP